MHSSTSSFERLIPNLAWRNLTVATVALSLAAVAGWEMYARHLGYEPTLNDTSDLWAERRAAVKPDSTVIIGDSRALFDFDLDVLAEGLGQRPIQLALVGSSAFPILKDLIADESFHGTIITGMVPLMFLAPGGPLVENSEKALKRFHTQTVAQRLSHRLGMLLEEHIAFLKQEDLTLEALLGKLPIPDRAAALIPPRLPPYFGSIDRERRTRMFHLAEQPGPLQTRVKEGWPALFTPPPPPKWIPQDAFMKFMGTAIESRFTETAAAVKKFRARGGKVVFVRLPVSGLLKQMEDKATPRTMQWTRILNETQAPGIYFEDFDELAHFDCPEWSHLSGPDSVEFTRRVVPHLKKALSL